MLHSSAYLLCDRATARCNRVAIPPVFRLTNEDVVDLYNRTPIGAKVIVFGTGKPAAAAQ